MPPLLKQINIGIIRGAGVGNKLADVFIRFLELVIDKENTKRLTCNEPYLKVNFHEDKDRQGRPYVYDSFKSLTEYNKDFKKKSQEDAEKLESTVKKWFLDHDIKTIFRTSINAEALYLFRQKVKAIKEIALETPVGGRMLIIRDQAEGFYANSTYSAHEELIHFGGFYTKFHQQKLVEYALTKASNHFGEHEFKCLAIYKFHLFGNFLENWIMEAAEKRCTIIPYQPDNGLTELIQFINKSIFNKKNTKNLLVICSNEVGDVILESIMTSINIASPKTELYSKNIYLDTSFNEQITEFQTVHGSADDLEDSKGNINESLNPIATFRIAAYIAEQVLKVENAREKMEEVIVGLKMKGLKNTTPIIDFIFSEFSNHSF